MQEYENLLEYQRKITDKQYILNILEWDLRVSTPRGAKEDFIQTKSSIEMELFDLKTAPVYETLLENCIHSEYFGQLSEEEQRYIKSLLRRYQNDKKIPSDFYKSYKELCSTSNVMWEEAREKNDYQMFKPYLEKVIHMRKQYYLYINPTGNVYDTMLNEYEEGMTSDIINPLFEELKTRLIPFIQKIKSEPKQTEKYEYQADELLQCAQTLLHYIGFDMNRGALGIYPHGFTEKMAKNDVRIAFKKSDNPTEFVATIIHEGGHGILEQNIMPNLSKYENACIQNRNALHESQSRFYENILGRNKNFWYPIYNEIQKQLKLKMNLDEFVKTLNTVYLSKIRTEADEVTYCLHIIIRYEIERDLFKGKITVEELPQIWESKMKQYLDVDITNDNEGLMQDVHWSEGEFGYFPSYLLGTIYDGMFLEAIEEQLGSVDEILKQGRIKEITEFLSQNIYQYGSAYTSLEMIERICHKTLSIEPIMNYFEKKYNNE